MNNKHELHFIENMKVMRKRSNITQDAFADLLGIKRSRLGAWEEKRACPSIGMMVKICQLFNVSLDEMLGVEAPTGAINEREVIRSLEKEVRNIKRKLKTIQNLSAA